MPVRVLVRSVYPSVGRTDSGTIDLFEINLPTANTEQSQLLGQRERVDAGIDKSTQDHVAAGAGKTIEIECFHKTKSATKRLKEHKKEYPSCWERGRPVRTEREARK
jgi:hypothetical protein